MVATRLPDYTTKKNNKSGYRGVSWEARQGRWRACYRADGKTVYLGMFDDIHDAGCAASDYRLTHVVEIAAVYDRGRINKSQSVKTHRASQTPQQRREQALKGHRKRKGLLSTNQSGYKGVSWNSKSKRWYVTVMIDGKKKRLGSYVDVHEAGRVIEAFRENEAIENLDHA